MTEKQQTEIFNEWIRQYRSVIFKVVHVYSHTRSEQDDLFQEIALQVWSSIPRFKGQSSEKTWIYRIALNIALKWLRREKKHRTSHEELEKHQHVLLEAHPIDQRLIWLYEQITRLNEIDRSLALLLLDGFSYKEIAGIMGISESLVGVKLHRIRKYLVTKSKKIKYGV
ncbi:MAG: RNA polymerase sigma factor [Candidatus Cyclobacteriaceae bacterium M3_2C_046]